MRTCAQTDREREIWLYSSLTCGCIEVEVQISVLCHFLFSILVRLVQNISTGNHRCCSNIVFEGVCIEPCLQQVLWFLRWSGKVFSQYDLDTVLISISRKFFPWRGRFCLHNHASLFVGTLDWRWEEMTFLRWWTLLSHQTTIWCYLRKNSFFSFSVRCTWNWTLDDWSSAQPEYLWSGDCAIKYIVEG